MVEEPPPKVTEDASSRRVTEGPGLVVALLTLSSSSESETERLSHFE